MEEVKQTANSIFLSSRRKSNQKTVHPIERTQDHQVEYFPDIKTTAVSLKILYLIPGNPLAASVRHIV